MSEAVDKLRDKQRELARMLREAKRLAGSTGTAADEHRRKMAAKSRQEFAAVAEIGEIPAVVHPKRKAGCKRDLIRFLRTYFPQSTGLKPFSEDHQRAIGRIQRCALSGGQFVNVFPRGFAKSTIGENAVLWATLYGHCRFVALFGADAGAAASSLDSLKLELAENDLLMEDFPEVCHAVRKLENKPQRCASQTHGNDLTHIEWTAETLVLPTINGSAASGAILTARGLTAAILGMRHKCPDGTQQRPDLVIIDDPQTAESAASPLQINKRLDIIRKSILKLGGHGKRIACVVNATVIQPDDLVEQLLDAKRFPSWQGERIPMVRKWSDAHETLWLTDYAGIRNRFEHGLLGDQQRAHKEATEFYRRNRAAMDAGCIVSWEHCYDGIAELSAIQHAYNLLIDDGLEVFSSEFQNQPIRPQAAKGEALTAEQIAEKLSNVPRGVIPQDATRLVCFIDPKADLLYWTVVAFADGFTGYVVDYGTTPDQRQAYFAANRPRQTLHKLVGGSNLEETMWAGLDRCVSDLMGREWRRQDGAVLRPERILIDANWGKITDVVRAFCSRSAHAAVLLPSHGRFVGASSRPFNEYRPKPGERMGTGWRIGNASEKRHSRYCTFDANHWKSFVHARLAQPMGGRGCLSLFGDKPEAHRLFADHMTAEQGIEVSAKGRSVTEWKQLPGRDNDWLDATAGCCLAASIQGVSLIDDKAAPRKKLKFSELAKRRSTQHA